MVHICLLDSREISRSLVRDKSPRLLLISRPFVIDLDSTNGTHVNDQEIPKSRYYELRNSDGKLACIYLQSDRG